MRELVNLGVEVHVALPIDGTLVKLYESAGIIIHSIDYDLKVYFRTVKCLRRIVKEVKPDVIHSHFVLTTIIMRLALRKFDVPRIFQVPGPLHLESFLFKNLELLLSQKKRDYWIASCNWTNQQYLRSGIPKERLFLSYYGTDLDFIKKQKGTLKTILGLDKNSFVVGMVAYMYAPKRFLCQKRGLKGHEDFIDALALLLNKYHNLYGVCIGGAWDNAYSYEKQIINYSKKKCGDRMLFLGNRNDVPALYGDMDLVVHPSHSENLGGAGESLLLEVPTIASNVGGFPDIIIDNKTGLLIRPKNPHEFACAIEKFINRNVDVDLFKKEGLLLTKNLLDVKNTAKEVFMIYNKILEY
jgi:glycosyltransferase involved in cell wall biosynthesis